MKSSVPLSNANLLKLSSDLLGRGTSVRFRATGFSMRPFIRDGDFIIVAPAENSSISLGDVVFFSTAENKVIAHRVIKRSNKYGIMSLIIKGDASFGAPEIIDIQNVLGKVVAIERNGRKRNLNTRFYRTLNLLFAGISPFSQWIYPTGSILKNSGHRFLGGILENLQSLRLYSILVRRLIRKNVGYQIASSDDAYSLSRLYRYNQLPKLENPTDALMEQLKDPGNYGYCIVAKKKDRVIGSVMLSEFQESDDPYSGWWLFGMKVHWRYRRLGIGEKLTNTAANVAAKHGASEIKLFVFQDANPANALYRKAGFHQISIPELDKQFEEEAKKSSRRRIVLAKQVHS